MSDCAGNPFRTIKLLLLRTFLSNTNISIETTENCFAGQPFRQNLLSGHHEMAQQSGLPISCPGQAASPCFYWDGLLLPQSGSLFPLLVRFMPIAASLTEPA